MFYIRKELNLKSLTKFLMKFQMIYLNIKYNGAQNKIELKFESIIIPIIS